MRRMAEWRDAFYVKSATGTLRTMLAADFDVWLWEQHGEKCRPFDFNPSDVGVPCLTVPGMAARFGIERTSPFPAAVLELADERKRRWYAARQREPKTCPHCGRVLPKT